ncbi:MAG: glycoside hydrolase family 38 C-terminal domain-containing protein [Capsulimonadaceae bacterium]|nr:glycoside hydrolase family 38 C-terminal domain-containing protein [Capsulimonadaceae bacterium]
MIQHQNAVHAAQPYSAAYESSISMPIPISPEARRSPHFRRIDSTFARLPAQVYSKIGDLEIEAWVTDEPVPYAQRQTGRHSKLSVGDRWGDIWKCAWFHFTAAATEAAAGKNLVALIDIGGEGLVVDANGNPSIGITTISSGYDFSLGKPGKRVVPIVSNASGSEVVDFWMDGACNDLFGRLPNGGKIDEARLATRWDELQALCFDFEVLRELIDHIPAHSARWAQTVQALYDAAVILEGDLTEDKVEKARAILAVPLSKQGGDAALQISAIGHAHVDLAWLWPIRETIRKGARTFATALQLMDRYPDYVFGASQPQLFLWMKEYYPHLYSRIQKRVAEGRLECQGGMWVEPDANIPSGESLVRQILYGKRFFREEFGKEIDNLWLPDVFGYSGSIPQILRKSGIKYFMTQKLSWSEVNTHPHHTFHWEGIDGSSVLVHMPPEDTYNSPAAPRSIAKSENQYFEKAVSDRCLIVFGIGDGGGGPGEEHLERLDREKNLLGLAPVTQEPASVFFAKLDQPDNRYPTWAGELYLEKHQGTLTSQARNKRYNRKMEIALHNLEYAAAQAARVTGKPYPAGEIDEIWREVLLYQFHDILPGSSITRVYDESRARYEELLGQVEHMTADAEREWLGVPAGENVLAAVNTLAWERTAWVSAAGKWVLATVPPLAASAIVVEPDALVSPSATSRRIENELLRLEFTEAGNLFSIYDKENRREILRANEFGNAFTVYHDHGDAWDFAADYESVVAGTFICQSSEAFVDGPRAGVVHVRRFGDSTMTQTIRLTSGSRRVDFETHVDWREADKMLRVRFPVAVAANEALCEIQFGHIARPTHPNTSWDEAKFEVCGQKWVDLSEQDYGVALLNDCKYGHRTLGGNLDLNLLRATGAPDPIADRAEHAFTYSILPHSGNLANGGVIREAYQLNNPLRIVPAAAGSRELGVSLASVDADNIIIETVKRSEDGDAIVLRLYEAHGASARTTLSLGFDVHKAAIVDLMELNDQPLAVTDNSVALSLHPFEIVTVKVWAR